MGRTYIGSSKLKRCYFGTTKDKKIYLDTNKVFGSGIEFTIDGTTYNLEEGTEFNVPNVFKAVATEGLVKIWILKVGDSALKFEGTDGWEKNACLVAGGGPAGQGHANGYFGSSGGVAWGQSWGRSGVGGDGGEVLNITPQIVDGTPYNVTVGSGNQNTTAFGSTARAGKGKKGASVRVPNPDGSYYGNWIIVESNSAGLRSQTRLNGTAEDGVYAFNDADFDGVKYGPGGGAGFVSGVTHYQGYYAETAAIAGGQTDGTRGRAGDGSGTASVPNRGAGGASGDSHGPGNGDGTTRSNIDPGSGIIMFKFTEQ